MQAVIVTGGKQYVVKEGDELYIEKLNAEAEETVTFDQVLAIVDGENSKFGTPVVAGASVTAKVLKNGKGKKIIVFKYRPADCKASASWLPAPPARRILLHRMRGVSAKRGPPIRSL